MKQSVDDTASGLDEHEGELRGPPEEGVVAPHPGKHGEASYGRLVDVERNFLLHAGRKLVCHRREVEARVD